MRFLANENFPRAAVTTLRTLGHDVAWVRVDAPGSSDRDVLACAIREKRLLLTFDKDFGELAQGAKLPPECGIVLFRMPMPAADQVGRRLAGVPTAREDRAGNFSVVDSARVRMRRFGK